MYNQASLRQYGDHQHFVAYVEVDNPAYEYIKQLNPCRIVPYYNRKEKMKEIGADFYFSYKGEVSREELCQKLEGLLNRKCKTP